MRDSADSYDPAYGRIRRAKGKRRGKFDDEETYAKRDRHVERLQSESTAADHTDDLPEGDRWSTWDQTENRISSDFARRSAHEGCDVAIDGQSLAWAPALLRQGGWFGELRAHPGVRVADWPTGRAAALLDFAKNRTRDVMAATART
ncbi:MAG: hypothetical protein ACRDN0_30740, partial [Trebonia sp.]